MCNPLLLTILGWPPQFMPQIDERNDPSCLNWCDTNSLPLYRESLDQIPPPIYTHFCDTFSERIVPLLIPTSEVKIEYFISNWYSLFLPESTYLPIYKIYFLWLDSNRGSLELEVTALPTEPQPQPLIRYTYISDILFSGMLVLPGRLRLVSSLGNVQVGREQSWSDDVDLHHLRVARRHGLDRSGRGTTYL